MVSDLIKQLSDPFPPEVIKDLPKGGTTLSYIPVSEVITRLNDVLGTDWEYRTKFETHGDWVIAHVALEIRTSDGSYSSRDGVGGSDTTRKGMDFGDHFKSALSDGLKKAAQGFGVGLHLARDETAVQATRSDDELVSEAEFNKIRERLNTSLDPSERAELMAHWKQTYKDVPFVHAEATRARMKDVADTARLIIAERPDEPTEEPEFDDEG
jgi:hypothetical protein